MIPPSHVKAPDGQDAMICPLCFDSMPSLLRRAPVPRYTPIMRALRPGAVIPAICPSVPLCRPPFGPSAALRYPHCATEISRMGPMSRDEDEVVCVGRWREKRTSGFEIG